MFSCDCSINLQTLSKAASAMSLRHLPVLLCPPSTDHLPSIQMPCRVLKPVEVVPFLEGKADQSKGDCRCKALRRASQDVLEPGVKPSGSALQSWKTKTRRGPRAVPAKATRQKGDWVWRSTGLNTLRIF